MWKPWGNDFRNSLDFSKIPVNHPVLSLAIWDMKLTGCAGMVTPRFVPRVGAGLETQTSARWGLSWTRWQLCLGSQAEKTVLSGKGRARRRELAHRLLAHLPCGQGNLLCRRLEKVAPYCLGVTRSQSLDLSESMVVS